MFWRSKQAMYNILQIGNFPEELQARIDKEFQCDFENTLHNYPQHRIIDTIMEPQAAFRIPFICNIPVFLNFNLDPDQYRSLLADKSL